MGGAGLDLANPPPLQQWSYGFTLKAGGSFTGRFGGKAVRFLQPLPDGSPGVAVHEVGPVMLGAGVDTSTVAVGTPADVDPYRCPPLPLRPLPGRAGRPRPWPVHPAQYARIAPATVTSSSDDPVSRDPAVKAAELAVREAREAYQPFEAAWLETVATHRTAEMAPDQTVTDGRGGLFSLGSRRRLARVGELARQRKDAREEMELAWRKVVDVNDKLRQAILEARIRKASRGE